MKNVLKELEKISRQLEPNSPIRDDWNQQVLKYSGNFLDGIEGRKAFVEYTGSPPSRSVFELDEQPTQMDTLISQIDTSVDTPGLNPASPGHLAYVPGGGIFPSALGDYLAAVFNKYAGVYYPGPGPVQMEHTLVRWMCDLIGFPDTALGDLTSGGSIATLTAMVTARIAKGLKASTLSTSVIYLTEQAHHCAQKALKIAGMEEVILRYIPQDKAYRMNVDSLSDSIQIDLQNGLRPFMVIGSAGTTDVGAIDPLDQIGVIAKQHDLWYHIDAAYGGFFLLVDEFREKFNGISMADSIVIDPHKGLFIAYGTGAVLIKDVNPMFDAHHYTAQYLQDAVQDGELSPADLSPELSRHFRGLRMWMPLKLFGLTPFRAALKEKAILCNYAYQHIQKLGFETGPPPEISIFIFRHVPTEGSANEFNRKLTDWVRKDGRVFLSSTTLDGVFWIRLAVSCFRTHLDTIKTFLSVIEEGRADIQKTGAR